MSRIKLICKSINEDGIGITSFNNLPCYVENFLPNEEAEVQIIHKGYNKYFARIIKHTKISEKRVEPKCRYFNICGGCQLMHIDYDEQIKIKKEYVKKLFSEKNIEIDDIECIKQENNLFYRNKIQAPIVNNKRGFYKLKSKEFNVVETCFIENYLAQKIIKKIIKLNVFGLDYVFARVSKNNEQVILALVTKLDTPLLNNDQIKSLVDEFPCIKSLYQSVKTNEGNKVMGDKQILLFGDEYIIDEIDGIKFKISLESFYQVNPVQTEILYKKAIDFALLDNDDIVLDAYCGVGTISLLLANKVKSVEGVEIIESAIYNAQENSKINGIQNATFICDDATNYILNNKDKFNVMFVDPPRKGLDDKFIKSVLESNIEKIVYVSCNPKTLCENINKLKEKYSISKIGLVDMFPQTGHVEVLTLLQRKMD